MNKENLTYKDQSKRNMPSVKDKESTFGSFSHDIENLFDDLSSKFFNLENFIPRFLREGANLNLKILPKIDISETDKEYVIEADLPGVKEGDIDILVSKNNILTIKGKRESKEENKERNYYHIERSYGSFERLIQLPENCDSNKVNANFKDGNLIVKIVKKDVNNQDVKKIPLNQ